MADDRRWQTRVISSKQLSDQTTDQQELDVVCEQLNEHRRTHKDRYLINRYLVHL